MPIGALGDTAARPTPPDPGPTGSQMLSWLIRLGGARLERTCRSKFGREFNLEDWARDMGSDKIRIQRTRGGERVVVIVDAGWAKGWTSYYGVVPRHHSEYLGSQ